MCIITQTILYQGDLCGHHPERAEIKHSSLILQGGQSTEKSLQFIIFRSFPAYHKKPIYVKARDEQGYNSVQNA